mmetsp:Transcript_4105/g.5034  ORF Transcript_4105/g.5034 Transcript_4105/m.5034 type:complete len:121 (+) Transcript_4105:1214-1576(+)
MVLASHPAVTATFFLESVIVFHQVITAPAPKYERLPAHYQSQSKAECCHHGVVGKKHPMIVSCQLAATEKCRQYLLGEEASHPIEIRNCPEVCMVDEMSMVLMQKYIRTFIFIIETEIRH